MLIVGLIFRTSSPDQTEADLLESNVSPLDDEAEEFPCIPHGPPCVVPFPHQYYNVFDPNPEPNFPVEHWSKKKLRDATQRLKEVLQILDARESNHTADIHRLLDAQDQQTAHDTRDQQGTLDSISADLLSVSTAVRASLIGTQRAVWQIGNRTANAAQAHDSLVAASWRRLTNESAALDRNDFHERANLARALAA
eukprot:CAMPEP_0172181396 /NCGR_PEP_ID=MMETSP1050-20130122/17792_1 /TAXON_ID=233186 /ORGANISM="Cryptomonas curvata, Strain CCAP979/52" /LENGTH=195 /DNA_ID=CAMNT_0012854669 /DNA_START=199 /DNA_END=782 /DNA_ORIENTATION=-